MELALFVYLAGILGSLQIGLGVLIAVASLYGLIYSLNWSDNKIYYEDTTPYNKSWMKWVVGCILVLALLPSERVAYTMAGAYAVQKVVEHPSTEEVSRKVLDVINMKLDNHLKEKQTTEKVLRR